MIIYKRNFDENRCIYFLIKEEDYIYVCVSFYFIKYMENLENVSNIIKNKFNSQLIYNKKYLKAENTHTHTHTHTHEEAFITFFKLALD